MSREDSLSISQRTLVTKIRERICRQGRAYIGDDQRFNAEQLRVLQSLDVVERRGDELLLVQDLSP
jgi:hypothetical protein